MCERMHTHPYIKEFNNILPTWGQALFRDTHLLNNSRTFELHGASHFFVIRTMREAKLCVKICVDRCTRTDIFNNSTTFDLHGVKHFFVIKTPCAKQLMCKTPARQAMHPSNSHTVSQHFFLPCAAYAKTLPHILGLSIIRR